MKLPAITMVTITVAATFGIGLSNPLVSYAGHLDVLAVRDWKSSHVSETKLKKGMPGCDSLKSFRELLLALRENDNRAINYLTAGNGCISLPFDAPVSVLERPAIEGVVRVRAYIGADAVELWVFDKTLLSQ